MEREKRKNWLSIFIKFTLGILLLCFFFIALLHVPTVQNKIANWATSKVIDKSGGTITISQSKFDLNKGMQMKSLVLKDAASDTLLTIRELSLSPKSTLLTLLNRLEFNDFNIVGISINVHRGMDEEKTNWERFIKSMSTSNKNENATELSIPLSNLELYDLDINYTDDKDDKSIRGTIAGVELSLNTIEDNSIDIEKIILIEPKLRIDNFLSTASDESMVSKDAQNTFVLPAISIEELALVNANMELTRMDLSNIKDLNNLDVLLKDFRFKTLEDWSVLIEDISGSNGSVDINHLGVNRVKRFNEKLSLKDVFLRLHDSYLSFDVDFTELKDFNKLFDSRAIVNLKTSRVKLQDLFPLIPSLKQDFGKEPMSREFLQIEGDYLISKTDISGDKIKIWLGESHFFQGRGVFTKTGSYNESLLNFEVKELSTDLNALDRDIGMIDIPVELKRLGAVNFTGTFDGFLNDFVAQGLLETELGLANMDIQFDLRRSHPDSIGYAGYLSLNDFDMARLLQNNDFGLVNLSFDINKGGGIDLINSKADLSAMINQFEYKGYQYKDAVFDGKVSSKIIDGSIIIEDDNLDFQFDGIVDLSQEIPVFDFKLDANQINFCALNLATFPCKLKLKSEINLTGSSIKNIEGSTLISDVVIVQDSSELNIKELTVSSLMQSDSTMNFALKSDFIDVNISGEFNLLKMGQKMIQQMIDNHKDHLAVVKVTDTFGDLPDQNFRYDVLVKDAQPVFDFLNIDLELGENTKLVGDYRPNQSKVGMLLEAPYFSYKGVEGKDVYLNLDSQLDLGEIKLRAKSLRRDNVAIDEISIVTHLRGNELYQKSFIDINEENRIDLETKSTLLDGGYYTQFLYDDLLIDSTIWTILPNKGIGIYPKAIDIENFIVTDGARSVSIKDLYKRGIDLSLKEFNFEFINPIINYDKLYFTGNVNAQLVLDDLYGKSTLVGFVDVPDFTINGDDYGSLYLKSKRKSGNILDVDLSIEKDSQNLYVKGIADLDSQYVNTHLSMQKYPLAFLEFIIEDGISETTGLADIELDLYGTFDDIKMRGDGYVTNGGVKIDYIGAYYLMSNDQIKITEKFIDLGDVTLTDEKGNNADLRGGLRHNALADFRADIFIESDNFIALNTTEEDNPMYYGLGMGPVDVSFKGPFERIDMNVNATAGANSLLYIPITSTQYGYDESFINFNYNAVSVDSNSVNQLVEQLKSSGVNFEMNLSFSRDAEVQVIYDKETSNVLIGRGEGNLQINVKRDGDFTVYGQYDVESGEYLYTSYGFIAKPFIIEQGGTVTWTGDPINAVLDVRAYYPNLRAPLNRFLQEYVNVDPTLQESDFRQRRNIDLDMILTGNLFNPAINFDISFPDLIGNLKTYADGKVRTLKATDNGINNQVLGLMVFNNFLPDNDPLANIQASNWAQLGGNTITEFLTSQLSLMATEYLSKLIEGDIISGVDFDIALAQNNTIGETGVVTPDGNFIEFVPDEVQLNLRNEFKNDNFVLNLGGNYVRENPLNTANNYLTGDFSLDWFITDDKRLKLQFYGVYDYDEAAFSRRQKYGFGINYRREFGKLNYQSLEKAFNGVVKEVESGSTKNASLR